MCCIFAIIEQNILTNKPIFICTVAIYGFVHKEIIRYVDVMWWRSAFTQYWFCVCYLVLKIRCIKYGMAVKHRNVFIRDPYVANLVNGRSVSNGELLHGVHTFLTKDFLPTLFVDDSIRLHEYESIMVKWAAWCLSSWKMYEKSDHSFIFHESRRDWIFIYDFFNTIQILD